MSIRCEDKKENMQGEGKQEIQGKQNRRRQDRKRGGNKQRGIQVGVYTCRGRSKKRKKGQNVISKSSWRT